jgi:D-inositol-3-phosphate glycosyltransferase
MRITLIGPVYPYRGGIAHYNFHLDRAFKEQNHQTQVISFRRQYPSWLYPGVSDQDNSQRPLKTQAILILDPMYPWTWSKAVREIIDFQPNFVVIHWWTTFWSLAFSYLNRKLSMRGIEVIYLIHNVIPHEQRPWDKIFARLALSNSFGYIVQTEQQERSLRSLVSSQRIQICPHPVYTEFTEDNPTQKTARQTLSIPDTSHVLLFFGVIRPYKGLDILLQALGKLRTQSICPMLVIAGEFWEHKQGYLALINDLQLQDQVTIHDRYILNEEIPIFFSAADLLIAPYTSGTQSGAVSIALGFGLPLIVSDRIAPGIDKSNRKNVRIVQSGNVEELASAIQESISERKKLDRKPAPDDWYRLVDAIIDLGTK